MDFTTTMIRERFRSSTAPEGIASISTVDSARTEEEPG
jgi:hypothetical protein